MGGMTQQIGNMNMGGSRPPTQMGGHMPMGGGSMLAPVRIRIVQRSITSAKYFSKGAPQGVPRKP